MKSNTEDVLLETYYIERFLYYSVRTHFPLLKDALERMINSTNSKVVLAGSRQVCLASLDIEEAKPMALKCITGT